MIFMVDECVLKYMEYEKEFASEGWKLVSSETRNSDVEVYLDAKKQNANYIITRNRNDFMKIAKTENFSVKLIFVQKIRPAEQMITCIKVGVSSNSNYFSIGNIANKLGIK